MQNYYIIPLVRFREVLYINLSIDHAKIFINLPSENHKNMFGFSAFHVGLPPKPTGNRSLPNGLPIETDWTGVSIWILNLFGFDRLPRLTDRFTETGGGRFGKVNPGGVASLPIISAGPVTLRGHAHNCPLLPDQTVAKNMCRFYWPCFLHYSRCASDSETDLPLKTRPFSPWTFSKFVCRDPDVLRKYHEQILAAGGVKSQVYWTMRLSCIRIWSNHA
jgi:hypothetical protein